MEADAVPDAPPGEQLVGRRAELASLRRVVADAERGRGGIALISGEPGIGKSRLLREMARRGRAAGFWTLLGRCSEAEGAPPYWPWIQALRNLLEQAGTGLLRPLRAERSALAGLLPELREPAPPDQTEPREPAPARRFRLFGAVIAFLLAAAGDAPALVLLDDLHRADADSLLLLGQLGGAIPESRVAVLGSLRDGEAPPETQPLLAEIAAGATALPLAGLGAADVGRWVELATGCPAPPELCRALQERTGGNPLFLGEMLRLVRPDPGRHDPASLAVLLRSPLPASVRNAILRRVERLPAPVGELLRRASVLGREFEVNVLASLAETPPDRLLDALDVGVAAHLLERVPESMQRFAFLHVLARDALHESLPSRERLLLHRRAADVIEALGPHGTEGRLEQLAQHLLASAPLGDLGRAADAAIAAGREARRRLALDQAAHYYRQALAALDDASAAGLPDLERRRCELRLALGDALWQVGATGESRQSYLRAAVEARGLDDPHLLARAAIGAIGRDDAPIDPPLATVALVEEAVRRLPPDPDPLRARLLSASAHVLSYATPTRRAEAEAQAREAVAVAERLGDPETRLYALLGLHHALWTPDRLAERLALSSRLVAMAPAAGSRRAEALGRHWRAVDLLESGDVTSARAEIHRYARLAEELRQPLFTWLASALQAMLALLDGRLDEAESLVPESFALGQRAGSANVLALFGDQLFHLREHQHRLGELEALMQQVTHENPGIRAFEIGLPLIHADAGRLDRARGAFDRLAARDFDDFPRDGQWLAFLHAAARVCAALADRPRAERLLALLAPFERQCVVSGHGTYWAGSVARYTALLRRTLGDGPGAAHGFEQAIETHRAAGARCLLAHTLREYAELLAAEGRRAPARSLAEEALGLYREAGTEGWAAAAEALLRELPGRRTWAPPIEGRLLCEGSDWLVEYHGVRARVADAKGMRDLAVLLAAPEREVHVLELTSPGPVDGRRAPPRESGLVARGAELGDRFADARARAAYRERLAELREELAEAESRCDLGACARAREEIGWIEGELAGARDVAPDRTSRARKAVYNRIQAAIGRIEAALPPLGRHLRNSIRTGTTCSYHPEKPVAWSVRTHAPRA